jgi:light-regulated signal transduction histidine kinase (bacteriophytochrome)/ActR/RegA family two-component response regulator
MSEIDLSECEREPINLLGQIQPYGILFVLDEANLKIRQVSANIRAVLELDPSRLLDRPITEFLHRPDAGELQRTVAALPQAQHRLIPVSFSDSTAAMFFDAALHRWDGSVILELLPATLPEPAETERLSTATSRIADQVATGHEPYQLAQQVTAAVQDISGYDRVMVYKFHPDWSGEVIAETRKPELVPYLGLRYPASDIPSQARDLFRRMLLRVIVDVNEAPAGLVPSLNPATGRMPDLTYSVLRSASFHHVEYLQNMNVRASLTASILLDGELWGMIACHHTSRRAPAWQEQLCVGHIAQQYARRLDQLRAQEQEITHHRNEQFRRSTKEHLEKTGNPVVTTLFGPPHFAEHTRADAVAIVCDGTIAALGNAPDDAWLESFARWLAERRPADMFVTDELAKLYPCAAPIPDAASGALARVISVDPLICIMCLRGELVREIHWGGNPQVPALVSSDHKRLSPRKSFDLWRETVIGRSAPWTQRQIGSLAAMASGLTEWVHGDVNLLVRKIMEGAETLAGRSRTGSRLGRLLMAALPDQVGDLLWEAEAPTGKVIYASPRFRKNFNIDEETLASGRIDDILAGAGLSDQLCQRGARTPERMEIWSSGMNHRTLEVRCHPVLQIRTMAKSRLLTTLSVADVTRQSGLESTLKAAVLETERAKQAKADFLAATSHDLRQPLQAAELLAAMIETKVQDTSVRESLHKLMKAQQAVRNTLDALLEIARFDAGVIEPSLSAFSIDELLAEIHDEAVLLGQERGLEVRRVRSGALVRSDAELLARIVRNLVSNAVRYTPKGKILIGVRNHMESVRIEVWDTGIGIEPDQLDTIFDDYYQIANPERNRNKGLGLGLAIVKRIAALLGLEIGVRSWPGKGSVFSVLVPRAPATNRDCQPAATRERKKSTSETVILVIDDDALIRQALELCITDWGYRAISAASASEAMDRLSAEAEPPNFVIADYRLENQLTGTQAVELLRGRFNTTLPGIIITGDTNPERVREAARSGLSVLFKPIDPTALQGAIRSAVTAPKNPGTCH